MQGSQGGEDILIPAGSDGKESACSAGDQGLTLGLGRSPGERHGHPLHYSCLENHTEEPGVLQSVGLQRVGHDWATNIAIDRMSGVWFWAWKCPDQLCGLSPVNFLGLRILIWKRRWTRWWVGGIDIHTCITTSLHTCQVGVTGCCPHIHSIPVVCIPITSHPGWCWLSNLKGSLWT